MPRNEDVKFEDIIRGGVSVNTNNLMTRCYLSQTECQHITKMLLTTIYGYLHVVRGEEWPLRLPYNVYIGPWVESVMPKFAHLPLILKPDGNGKLSKGWRPFGFPSFQQIGPTQKQEKNLRYRERGYYPEAFNNMLAFWVGILHNPRVLLEIN